MENLIEFNEELLVEDLQIANYYNFRKQKKYLFNQLLFIGMSGLMIAMSISQKEWVFLGVGIILLIFSIFLFLPFYKWMIYRAVRKSMAESLKIKLVFDEENFIYATPNTEEEEIKYTYDQVKKVIDLPDYIYLYFSMSMIAIVKKSDCNQIKELEDFIENKYSELKIYEKVSNMPK